MKKKQFPISTQPNESRQRGSSASAYRNFDDRSTTLQEKLGFVGLPSRSTTPALARRGKSRSLVLQSPSDSSVGFSLILDPLYPWSLIASHLVTQAVYKGLTVVDWFIIYQDLEDNCASREDEHNVARAVLLTLVVRAGSFTTWDQRIRPLKPQKVLLSINNDDIFEDLDDDEPETINEFFRIARAPQKSERDLYRTRLGSTVKAGIPPERYIGVGYKDHGHLPDPTEVRVPEIEEWKPSLDCSLDRVIEMSKKYFRSWKP